MKNNYFIAFIFFFLFLPGLSLANSYYVCLQNETSCADGCCPESHPLCFVHQKKGYCCPSSYPESSVSSGQARCCQDATCAQQTNSIEAPIGAITVQYDGLVPCGRCLPNPGVARSEFDIQICGANDSIYVPCQICHFFIMAEAILGFIAKNVIYLAVLMIVLAGGMLVYGNFFSPGNPQLISEAIRKVRSVLIGLAIYFCLFLLVNLLFFTLGVARTNLGRDIQDWFQITCAPQLENIEIGGRSGPIRPPECKTPCSFEFSGPCPPDKPTLTPVTGGVCCCPFGGDICATLDEQKCGMRLAPYSNRCTFPYVAGELAGVCCQCQDVGGIFLEWRVLREACFSTCSLDASGKCDDPMLCF